MGRIAAGHILCSKQLRDCMCGAECASAVVHSSGSKLAAPHLVPSCLKESSSGNSGPGLCRAAGDMLQLEMTHGNESFPNYPLEHTCCLLVS